MKKTLLLLSLSLSFYFIAFAQDFPDFGKPAFEEWAIKDCAFDKDAGAMVLIHEAFSYSEDNLQLITSHHLRIKILKQSGYNAAVVKIPFIRFYNFERIIQINALTLNKNGDDKIDKQKVTKKTIYTSNINEVLGEITFVFPSVKEGSILEYQYKSVKQNYFGLQDWYFQREIPVLTSRYHLKMIPNKSFSYRMIQNAETETTILPGKDNIFVEMRKIPALNAEPYMDCIDDYRQRINFKVNGYDSRWGNGQVGTLTTSWSILNSILLYNKHFGPQIVKNVTAASSLTDSAKNIADEFKRMLFIYKQVRNRVTWNKKNNILANNVDKIWDTATGDNGDINMLLVNLLNSAQLKAFPLLISKRYNGKVDSTYPYTEQFNALFACVIINGKKRILDATDKYNSGNLTPFSVLNTTAFLIDRNNGELITIKEDTVEYVQKINIDLSVTNTGQLEGKAVIENTDYAGLDKLNLIKSDTANLKMQYAKATKLPIQFTDYSIEDIETEAARVLLEKLTFSSTLSESGNYLYIPLNLFVPITDNPFIKDKRYSDINFGYKQRIIVKGRINFGNNYTLEALPEDAALNLQDIGISFTRKGKLTNQNSTYEFEIVACRLKTYFTPDDYTALKNALNKVITKLTEQAVLRKKG